MSTSATRPTLFRLRPQLARRLALLAAAALAALLLLVVALGGGTALALGRSWQAITAGLPLAAALWSLAAVVLVLGAGALGAALFGTPPAPHGIRLPRESAPDFFRLVDVIASQLGVAPIEDVRIVEDMNAQVLQRPAWGVAGPMRTCLMIGLPLAHSLSPPQFAAVLAHELAHLGVQRRGWDGFAAHLRAWWVRTLDRLSTGFPRAGRLLDGHSRRYCNAMLRLARIEEFEADAAAARLVGAGLLGDALVEVSLKSRFLLRDYWPRVVARGADPGRSAVRPYREMGLGVEAGFVRSAAETACALCEDEGDCFALHPPLRLRLRALRVPLRVPTGGAQSAARHYFAALLPTLAWVFDRAWWADVRAARHPMQSCD